MALSIGYHDIMKMQSEAEQRVKEMQRRAQYAVQRANTQKNIAQKQSEVKESTPVRAEIPRQNTKATPLPLDYIKKEPQKLEKSAPPPTFQAVTEVRKNSAPNLLSELAEDYDKLLIIILILILSEEQADELLLMALGYIIM